MALFISSKKCLYILIWFFSNGFNSYVLLPVINSNNLVDFGIGRSRSVLRQLFSVMSNLGTEAHKNILKGDSKLDRFLYVESTGYEKSIKLNFYEYVTRKARKNAKDNVMERIQILYARNGHNIISIDDYGIVTSDGISAMYTISGFYVKF